MLTPFENITEPEIHVEIENFSMSAFMPNEMPNFEALYFERLAECINAAGVVPQQSAYASEAVAAVACTVLAPITGGGTLYGYMAAKGAVETYIGADQGGWKGALSGLATAGVNAVSQAYLGGMVKADLSYSYEDGWGGSVGLGVGPATMSVGYSSVTGMTAGASLRFGKADSGFLNLGMNWAEKQGFGASMSVGPNYREGTNANVGLNWQEKGGLSGTVGASYTFDKDARLGGGLTFNKDGFAGANLEAGLPSYTNDSTGLFSQYVTGLNYTKGQGFNVYGGIDFSQSLRGLGSDWKDVNMGINTRNYINFNNKGEFLGMNNTSDLNFYRDPSGKPADETAKDLDFFDKIELSLSGAWESVKGSLSQLGKAVKDGITGAGGMLADAGSSLWEGVKTAGNYIASGASTAWAGVTGLAGTAWAGLNNIFKGEDSLANNQFTITITDTIETEKKMVFNQVADNVAVTNDLKKDISEFKKNNPNANVYDFLYSKYKDSTNGQYNNQAATATLKSLADSMGVSTQEFINGYAGGGFNSNNSESSFTKFLNVNNEVTKKILAEYGTLDPTIIGLKKVGKWIGSFMEDDPYAEYNDKFVNEMKNKIGQPYILGGGNISSYSFKYSDGTVKTWSNYDETGKYLGFDCCGGVMDSIRKTTGLNIPVMEQNGMLTQSWLETISKSELSDGDLIFINVPGKANLVGPYDHVMTFYKSGAPDNLITTKGGDKRVSSSNTGKTIKINYNVYISSFSSSTQYKYRRINWKKLHEKYLDK
jgi:cell wall-associated NlpC family hydrolase